MFSAKSFFPSLQNAIPVALVVVCSGASIAPCSAQIFNDGSVSTLPQLFALPVPNPFESMDLVRASRPLQAPPPQMTFTAGFMQPPLQLQTISTDSASSAVTVTAAPPPQAEIPPLVPAAFALPDRVQGLVDRNGTVFPPLEN